MTPRRQQYRAPEGEQIERTTIRLPVGLLQRIEERAREHGRSVNLEIVTALQEHYT